MNKKQKTKWIASGFMVAVIAAIVIGTNCMNCAAIKPIGRVVQTIAKTLCETLATEKLEKEGPDALDGFNVSDFCAVKKNFDPILDVVLAAQKDAEKIVSEKIDEEKAAKEEKPKETEPPEENKSDPGKRDSSADSAP
jgi:hypothetical protein